MAASDIEQTHINVEVAFAEPHRQHVIALTVPSGTSAREAVSMADLSTLFPERGTDFFSHAPLGIYGQALREPADIRWWKEIASKSTAHWKSTPSKRAWRGLGAATKHAYSSGA